MVGNYRKLKRACTSVKPEKIPAFKGIIILHVCDRLVLPSVL